MASPITIHHLQVSQSERIPWLCEELGIPYNLKLYRRAPVFAPPEYKALHPSGSAPVIEDGDIKLAESGACVEYISQKHGGGRLFLKPSDEGYADFLYWWHWSNGTFQPALSRVMTIRGAKIPDDNKLAWFGNDKLKKSLDALEERLRENEWLAGREFTVADIMVVFSLTTMRYFCPYSLEEYGSVLRYLGRVGEREGYRRAMAKCDAGMKLQLGAAPLERPSL